MLGDVIAAAVEGADTGMGRAVQYCGCENLSSTTFTQAIRSRSALIAFLTRRNVMKPPGASLGAGLALLRFATFNQQMAIGAKH